LIFGKAIAWLAFLGMAIFIVPNAYFTYYAFRYRGSELTPWIRQSFMFGEMGKLSLVAVGFALAFVFVDTLNVAALFAGFIEMIILQWWLASRLAKAAAAESSGEQ